jgi:pimeloyl-ACP methyl ester carboxylesterase
MRARQPDPRGYAVNEGLRLFYEVHGSGPLSILLVPPWAVTTAAFWKMQLPFLARHFTTIAYDPRGNGRSDRPVEGYAIDDVASDALAVLDELAIERCALLTVSGGMLPISYLAARYPQRVAALAAVSGSPYFSGPRASLEEREARRRRIVEQFDDWVRGFWGRNFPEAHSTKAQDDGWEWTHETTGAITLAAARELYTFDAREVFDRIRCPVLLIHGFREDDLIESFVAHRGLPHSILVTIMTPGHLPNVRDPVKVNLILRRFFDCVVSAGVVSAGRPDARA